MADQGAMSRSRASATAPAAPAGRRKEYNKVISHYRYSEADVLGEGAYGSVYKAYDESTRDAAVTTAGGRTRTSSSAGGEEVDLPEKLRGCRVVALKQMSNAQPEDGLAAASLREIAILKELSHVLRSDQRQGSLTRLGGYATYMSDTRQQSAGEAADGGAAGSALDGNSTSVRPPRGAGEVTELSLTDQGNTSEAADDFAGGQSTPSPVPSPEGLVNVRSDAVAERDVGATLAQGRRYVLDMLDVIMESKKGKVYVALEFCEGGDAWHFLRNLSTRRIRDPRIFHRWVREMVLGVAFMHSKHISHRDLKPQNIMLKRMAPAQQQQQKQQQRRRVAGSPSKRRDFIVAAGEDDRFAGEEYTLKVADFGLSRVEGIPVKKYVHEAVTLWYRSPDVILGNTHYSYSADAWSLGCIIIEIASGAAPFRGRDEGDQLKRIFSRLGGPLRRDLPDLMEYPHSQTYAPVLESMVLYHEKEKQNGTFTEREVYELKQLLERHAATGAGAVSTSNAALGHVAANKARLRQLLENRGGGMDVLGEDGLDMVARLLIVDPKKRMTVLEAVQHPFLRGCLMEDTVGAGGGGEDDAAAAAAAAIGGGTLSGSASLRIAVEDGTGSTVQALPPSGLLPRDGATAYRRLQQSGPMQRRQPQQSTTGGAVRPGSGAAGARSQPDLPREQQNGYASEERSDRGVSLPALTTHGSREGSARGERPPVMVRRPSGSRSNANASALHDG